LGGLVEARAEPALDRRVEAGEGHGGNIARLTPGRRPRGQPPRTPSSVKPRAAAIRSIVSPILLFGVEAPAVIPIVTGPAGSHASRRCSSWSPTGRNRMAPAAGSMQAASST